MKNKNLEWFIKEFLEPIGFEPIFDNPQKTEFHFIKNGIRICYYTDLFNEDYVKVSYDCVSKTYPYTVLSGKFKWNDTKRILGCWEFFVKEFNTQ